MEQLAMETAGKAIIGRVHESERDLFNAFGVRGIPAVFVMYNAEIRESFTGTRPKEFLLGCLERARTE